AAVVGAVLVDPRRGTIESDPDQVLGRLDLDSADSDDALVVRHRNRLLARCPQRHLELPAALVAAAEGVIRGRRALTITEREVDLAGVIGDGMAGEILGGDGDDERSPGSDVIGGRRDIKVLDLAVAGLEIITAY